MQGSMSMQAGFLRPRTRVHEPLQDAVVEQQSRGVV
jgi:hypothetical protein